MILTVGTLPCTSSPPNVLHDFQDEILWKVAIKGVHSGGVSTARHLKNGFGGLASLGLGSQTWPVICRRKSSGQCIHISRSVAYVASRSHDRTDRRMVGLAGSLALGRRIKSHGPRAGMRTVSRPVRPKSRALGIGQTATRLLLRIHRGGEIPRRCH